MGAFKGFGKGAVEFFEDLAENNDRAWFAANKHRYESEIRVPLEHLLADLAGEFGEGKVYRPHRDTRFSKDKTPYKLQAAASVPRGYVSLSAEGLGVAGGGYMLARDQLARYRAAVDDDRSGKALQAIVDELRRAKATIGGHGALKTAPRGYPADHPRIELLRLDGVAGWWTHPPRQWLFTAKAADKVAEGWRKLGPLNDWVAEHVGASTMAER